MDILRRTLLRYFRRMPALQPGRLGWGAAQLSGANLASRLIGFVYSAAVMRLAGPEAVGLFRLVWPLYATAFTVSTAGVPYAMAKLIAERHGTGPAQESGLSPRTISTQGFALLAVNTTVASVLVWFFAPWLVTRVGGEPRALPILQLLVPALIVSALSAGVRSLYEGMRRMAIPAISLLAEESVLSVVAILVASHLASQAASPAETARGLAFASVTGEAAGLIILAMASNRLWAAWKAVPGPPGGAIPARGRAPRLRKGHSAPWWPREILSLALPVVGGRLLASVGASLTTLLLPSRLQAAGLSPSEAATQVGLLRGVALPLVLTPNMLSLALMTSLVPSVSRAMGQGRRDVARAYGDKALATTVLFAMPATALFLSMPEVWTRLLYGESGAAPLLVITAFGAPFVYLGQTLVGVLRGLGRPHVPVQSHLVALTLETALIAWWVSNPALGIHAAAAASVVGFAAGYLINQLDVLRRLGTELRARQFVVPMLAAAAGAILTRVIGLAATHWAASLGLPAILGDMVAFAGGCAVMLAVYASALRATPLWVWLVAQ